MEKVSNITWSITLSLFIIITSESICSIPAHQTWKFSSYLIGFVHLPYQCYLIWYLEGSYNFFKRSLTRFKYLTWSPFTQLSHPKRNLTNNSDLLTQVLVAIIWMHSFSDCLSACSLQVGWYHFIRFPNSRWIQVNISSLWQKLQN